MRSRSRAQFVFFVCGVSLSMPTAFAADDKESSFTTIYDSVITTYSPKIGEIHTAKIGEIIYSEEARPVASTFLVTKDVPLSFDGVPFVLKQGTGFTIKRRYGEIIYCYSVHKYANPDNLPPGNHCLWDENKDNVPDYYRLWVWGADDYTDKLPVEADSFEKTLQPSETPTISTSIRIGDRRSFSLELISNKKIKLGFSNGGGYGQQLTAAMLGIKTTDGFKNRIIDEMITLKYKGKEVTYVTGGMEITILNVTGDTLTYRIDQPLESRTLLNEDKSAFGIQLGGDLGKAKKK